MSRILIVRALLVFSFDVAASGVPTTVWESGSGDWTDCARWSPGPYKRVEVHGRSMVRVPVGAYPIANLQMGKDRGDHARVEIDGGRVVLLQDPLDIGDVTGSEGELIVKDGALYDCVDTYVGGGMTTLACTNGPLPRSRGPRTLGPGPT